MYIMYIMYIIAEELECISSMIMYFCLVKSISFFFYLGFLTLNIHDSYDSRGRGNKYLDISVFINFGNILERV